MEYLPANGNNDDSVSYDGPSGLPSENQLFEFHDEIERSALLHLEFWSQLVDEVPDLAQLDEIGIKINSSVADVQSFWNKMLRLGTNVPKAAKMYSKYLVEIRNDVQAAEDLEYQMKKSKHGRNRTDLMDDDDDDDDSADEAILNSSRSSQRGDTTQSVASSRSRPKKGRKKDLEANDDSDDFYDEDDDDDDVASTNLTIKTNTSKTKAKVTPKVPQNKAKEQQQYAKKFRMTFHSSKGLSQIVNSRKSPFSVSGLRWTSNLLVLVLLLLTVADYFVSYTKFQVFQNNFDAIDMSHRRTAELQNIVSKVRDLELFNLGLYTGEDRAKKLKADIGTSIDTLKKKFNSTKFDSHWLSNDYKRRLQDTTVVMQSYSDRTLKNTTIELQKAINLVTSQASNLIKEEGLSLYTEDNEWVYFIKYNNFNQFYVKLKNESDLYVDGLTQQFQTTQSLFFYLAAGASVALLVGIFLLIPFYSRINKARETMLNIFLDISEETVEVLYCRCDNFLSKWPYEQEKLAKPFPFENEKLIQKSLNDNTEQKKTTEERFSRNSERNVMTFAFQMLLGSCLIMAFFQSSFYFSKNLLSDMDKLLEEFNSTSVAESFLTFINNAERQAMIDNSLDILGQNPDRVVENNIRLMYRLDSDIHQTHSVNIKIHSSNYKEEFNKKMMSNPCNDLKHVVPSEDCEAFASGAITQGMSVALTRHFENLRGLLVSYRDFRNDTNGTKDFPTKDSDDGKEIQYVEVYKPNKGDNKIKNNILNLLRLSKAHEIDITQHLYIRHTFRILMDEFKDGISSSCEKVLFERLVLWAIFAVVVCFIYFCYWLPMLKNFKVKAHTSASLLSILPVSLAVNLKSMRAFLDKVGDKNKSSRRR